MSSPRYAADPDREPKPLARLTRPQIAARVFVLRQALDLLVTLQETDGGEGFTCRGSMKVQLISLEAELRKRDHEAERGEPMPLPVAFAAVRESAGRSA